VARAQTFEFSDLSDADLLIDAVYRGGRKGHAGDDPLSRLLEVSNQGGFRYRGNLDALEMLVLTSTLSDPDWPDNLDRQTGIFTYFGDNKHPGRALHDTPRNGNDVLRRIFELSHSGTEGRSRVPPTFVFANTGEGRDVLFLGLAVPGSIDLRPAEDLVAVWKTSKGRRFQNYRAQFTILDIPLVSRLWIRDIIACNPHSFNAPKAWCDWIRTGQFSPLVTTPSIEHRTKAEQLPVSATGRAIIGRIQEFFSDDPYSFEKCAASIVRLMLPDTASLELTRPYRDGGRDAIGKFRIGVSAASILVDFALEAKCYAMSNSVGVRELSRLISRLRHRQFGVLVTTSYVEMQAYKEIKEDGHPIIVICATDIVDLLRANGMASVEAVDQWLKTNFRNSDPPNNR
jgi:Restriction endonuclease AspBHI N-terminal/Restriction endonuclease